MEKDFTDEEERQGRKGSLKTARRGDSPTKGNALRREASQEHREVLLSWTIAHCVEAASSLPSYWWVPNPVHPLLLALAGSCWQWCFSQGYLSLWTYKSVCGSQKNGRTGLACGRKEYSMKLPLLAPLSLLSEPFPFVCCTLYYGREHLGSGGCK